MDLGVILQEYFFFFYRLGRVFCLVNRVTLGNIFAVD